MLSDVKKLLAAKEYAGLERLLSEAPAAGAASLWPGLSPMERLVAFKLLDAAKAMEVFEALPFDDRYFVLCGFPLQSIAPVLEDLTPVQRRPFVQLPRALEERMFRRLAEARA